MLEVWKVVQLAELIQRCLCHGFVLGFSSFKQSSFCYFHCNYIAAGTVKFIHKIGFVKKKCWILGAREKGNFCGSSFFSDEASTDLSDV